MPPSVLARLYDEHAAVLHGFLLAWTGSAAEARDVLQETFVRAAGSEVEVERLESPRAWLVTLARRHRAAAQEAPVLAPPTGDPDAAVMREAMEAALGDLPTEQRAAVILHVWGGLSFREISESMDVPLHTAASRCRYGLARLRKQLEPLYQEIK